MGISRIPADVISFQGNPGTDYKLQTTTNLANPAWHCLAVISGNTSGSYSYTNFPNPNQNQLYYRLYSNVDTNNLAFMGLDASSPLAETVQVTDTVNSNYLGLPLLVFDLGVMNGNGRLKNLTAHIISPVGGSGGSITSAYLYQGSTLIASANVVNGLAAFINIADNQPGAGLPAKVLVPYTIKADILGVTSGVGFSVSSYINNSDVTVYEGSSDDVQILVQGSSYGNQITVVSSGAAFSLAGSPTISKVNITPGGSTNTVFQYIATFNVNVTAIGGDVDMGLPGKNYPDAFGTNSSLVALYINGVQTDVTAYNVVASYSQPADTLLLSGARAFRMSQNQSVTIPVTYSWIITNPGANTYAFQIEGINWSTFDGTQQTTDTGETKAWLTPAL